MSGSKGYLFENLPRFTEGEGFYPRPVRPGTKACPFQKWTIPDPERKVGELDGWLESHGHWGIGLLLGSPFPDGSKLAAVDIDRDDYVRVAQALLRSPPCGRIGAKGIAYPVRLLGDGKYRALKVKGKGGAKVGEILCDKPPARPTTDDPSGHQANPTAGSGGLCLTSIIANSHS